MVSCPVEYLIRLMTLKYEEKILTTQLVRRVLAGVLWEVVGGVELYSWLVRIHFQTTATLRVDHPVKTHVGW